VVPLYRDTEASAIAVAWAGNGLELLHSKLVSKLVFMALFTAMGVVLSTFPALPGLEAWYDLEVSRPIYASFFGLLVLLPLICRTGRVFVHALQWWLGFTFLSWGASFVVGWAATGQWALAALWVPVALANVVVLRFRRGLVIRFAGISFLSGVVLQPAVACAHYDTHRAGPFKTFPECADASYRGVVPLLLLMGSYVLLRVGGKFANDALVENPKSLTLNSIPTPHTPKLKPSTLNRTPQSHTATPLP
jgi:hypothetical protein